jgi:hypothetical protein
MKIINKTKDKEFEPVTLEITFETKEEMSALWHRLNMIQITFRKHYGNDKCPFGLECVEDRAYPLWDDLDSIMERM